MSRRILYGVGYEPLGDLGDGADIDGLLDLVDPLGFRKVPEKVQSKVNGYIEEKTQRAAKVARREVEAGVRSAVSDAGSTALKVAAGGLLVSAMVGGVYLYTRHDGRRGAR